MLIASQANPLQVEISLCVERATVILPAGLPGYESSGDIKDSESGIGGCVVVTIPEIQLQLRLHDYYMGKSTLTRRNLTINLPLGRNVPQHRRHLWWHST